LDVDAISWFHVCEFGCGSRREVQQALVDSGVKLWLVIICKAVTNARGEIFGDLSLTLAKNSMG
jgi:hypothetical protein